VNAYEVLLMLDGELGEAQQSEIVGRCKEIVESGDGAWLDSADWGRRKLAYEIDHKTDAFYHLLTFDSSPAALEEVTRVMKITEGVMRHMAVRRIEGSEAGAAPPPPSTE
jgi:small subunit ribosomal protein S6